MINETSVLYRIENTAVFDNVVEIALEELDCFVLPVVGLKCHFFQVHFVQNDPIVVGTTLRGGVNFV